MFLGTFAWSFVYVSLPFHIQAISTVDPVATLRWTGWILGIAPLVTVATAPFWGRFAERANTKALYIVTQLLQGLCFLGTALARTLPELFLARLALGVMGASSTFAFIDAGRARDAAEVRRQVAAVQSGMTIGQVIGPLVGAIAAARLGFRTSFVAGGLILWGCAAVVFWGAFKAFGWDLSYRQAFGATTHAFLPGVLDSLVLFPVAMRQESIDPSTLRDMVRSNLGFLIERKASPALHSLLESLDVFSFWSLALFVVGFAAAARISRKSAAGVIVALWILYVLGKAGFAAIFS